MHTIGAEATKALMGKCLRLTPQRKGKSPQILGWLLQNLLTEVHACRIESPVSDRTAVNVITKVLERPQALEAKFHRSKVTDTLLRMATWELRFLEMQ